MESFFRYVGYIDILEEEKQVKTAGYLIWKYQNKNHNLEIQIKDKSITDSEIEMREENRNELLGKISMDKGYGEYKGSFHEDNQGNIHTTCGKLIDIRDITGIYAFMEDGRKLHVKIKLPLTEKETDYRKDQEIETKKEEEVLSKNITPAVEKSKKESLPEIMEPMKEEKWEQLCKKYRVVSPFSSEARFIMVKPEDFVILQQGYQKLVHNSFLLHGYYQYGHMILGRLEEKDDMPYYIGVPGVYYEEEKKAAKMFGFVGFEGAEGMIENGSYGYYMIEVKI